MKQYTETYRIKLSADIKLSLDNLKIKYHIIPAKFIRQAINEKLQRDRKQIKEEKTRIKLPF
jgi:predicted transcriptional regulator